MTSKLLKLWITFFALLILDYSQVSAEDKPNLTTHPLTSDAKTPEEFIAAFRAALQEKSTEKLDALTYSVGMSEEDKKKDKYFQQMWLDKKIDSISFEPLPEDLPMPMVFIKRGMKVEPTYPPTGLIQVKYKRTGGEGNSISVPPSAPPYTAIPYAVINGRYFLIPSKNTDLGWKGPPDKELIFTVMGWGKDKVRVKARWNASGVDQERTFKTKPFNLTGQYFDEVTVISTEEDTDVTLKISEGEKQIFVSEPLKGKGTIEYKKKSQ